MSGIQTLSVVVPTNKCINDCHFCVSKMHGDHYEKKLFGTRSDFAQSWKDFLTRLEYARDNGCNNVILTGTGEPQQNWGFLKDFGLANQMISKPFRHITIQTTGIHIDTGYLEFLRSQVGVTTFSLSVASFNTAINKDICSMAQAVDILSLCKEVKAHGFTLRASINCTLLTPNEFTNKEEEQSWLKYFITLRTRYGIDQATFRKLYASGSDEAADQRYWIEQNKMGTKDWQSLYDFIKKYGKFLNKLEYGQDRYDVVNISTVIDDDCMSQKDSGKIRYLILRPDCKLYTRWETPGSLLF